VDALALSDHVAQVKADADQKPSIGDLGGIALVKDSLDFDRAVGRGQGAWAFEEEPVANCFDFARTVAGEHLPQQPSVLVEQLERESLVPLG
jgi:hypothetical protein